MAYYEIGDFVHLISNKRRVNSGIIAKVKGNEITINSAVYHGKQLHLFFSNNMNAWFFPDDTNYSDGGIYESGFYIYPDHAYYLEKDDRRLPIDKNRLNK